MRKPTSGVIERTVWGEVIDGAMYWRDKRLDGAIIADENGDVEITVEMEWEAEEKQTWDCPGTPASIDVISVMIGSKDYIDGFEEGELIELIEDTGIYQEDGE